MPSVPDASSVTRFRRVNATTLVDPTKKSPVFLAPLKNVIPSVLRASDVGQDITPTRSVLGVPQWKSPQFNGRFFLK
jgi:hypothetical protein